MIPRPIGAMPLVAIRRKRLDRALPASLISKAEMLGRTDRRAADEFLDPFRDVVADRFDRFDLDLSHQLDTDRQRDDAAHLIHVALGRAERPEVIAALQAQVFRLSGATAEDPTVRRFVRDTVAAALAGRTGRVQSREKHFNVHDARTTLLECRRRFEAAGSRFFLDRGTLLGCIRDGGFVAGDYDIDLGVFADEITLDEVKALFDNSDFEVTQDFEYKVGVQSPEGVAVDFFLTSRHDGYFLSKGFRSIHNWYFTPFDLAPHEFLDEEFLVPATYEKHLDENYGNWRVPVVFYDLSYHEPCVVYGDVPPAFSYLTKRFGRALRQGDRYMSERPAQGLRRQFCVDLLGLFPSGGRGTVAPSRKSVERRETIRIVDTFESYTHLHRRLVESALSITPHVELAVLTEGSHVSLDDRLVVARGVDRVEVVGSSDAVVKPVETTSLRALVIPRSCLDSIAPSNIVDAMAHGCRIVEVVDDTIALTVVDGEVVARRREPESRPGPTAPTSTYKD